MFATIGSLGDLHPCLALGAELQLRGHAVAIAAAEWHRAKIVACGLGYHPMRPHWNLADPLLVQQCENLKRGYEVLYRDLLLPDLSGAYADLLPAAQNADVLLAGELALAAPLVAERLRLRWGSLILSPCSFLSVHDPSVLANVPWLHQLARIGRPVYRTALLAGKFATRHWWRPVEQLRREQGLHVPCDPIFQDKFSPDLVLALFSRELAKPQADWPRNVVQPGFCFFDEQHAVQPELEHFLAAGDPPVVCTLGSTAVRNPGSFWEVSLAAARRLGKRSLLVGASADMDAPDCLPIAYAPYADVFARAAAVVHQGGSGTLAQALRAGRPQLIVPYGWDQVDNAARAERLGVGLMLARAHCSADKLFHALERVLDGSHAFRAAEVARTVRIEDGIPAACDAIETALQPPVEAQRLQT